MKRRKPTREEIAAAIARSEAWERVLRERMARIERELGLKPAADTERL
jgi:hypothetical protein